MDGFCVLELVPSISELSSKSLPNCPARNHSQSPTHRTCRVGGAMPAKPKDDLYIYVLRYRESGERHGDVPDARTMPDAK